MKSYTTRDVARLLGLSEAQVRSQARGYLAPDRGPRNAYRSSLSGELLDAVKLSHQTVTMDGEGRFATACAAITLGDYVSTYLALLYGVDPSATPVLSAATSSTMY